MTLIILLYFQALSVLSGQSDNLGNILDHPAFDHTSVGISLRSLADVSESISVDSDRLLSPASSLKLITTFVGISILGKDFVFKTKLGYTGQLANDGTLSGNIVVVGGGDPTFGSSRWDDNTWADILDKILVQIKKAGITCIDGGVVIDASIYDGQHIPDEWNWNDIGNYYASGAWGLNINENLYKIYFQKNIKKGRLARVHHTSPDTRQVELLSEVQTAASGSGDNAYIYGGPYQTRRIIRGTIPQSKDYFSIKGSLPDPPLCFAELLHDKIEKASIHVYDKYEIAEVTEKLTILHTYQSPTLLQIVEKTNEKSINLYADAILHMIGHRHDGSGSIAAGLTGVEDWLSDQDLDTKQIIMKDGSGLAVENKITPSLMTDYLLNIKKSLGKTVLKAIPQAGKEGTVKNLFAKKSIAQNFYLKSGSFEGVLSYSGYMKGKSGKSYSLCIMSNNYTCSYQAMKSRLVKVMEALYLSH